jgi:hypothetical protein
VVADTLGDGADRNDPREHRGAGYAVGHRRGHAHILGGMHRHRPWRFPLARSDRHSLLARDHRRTICLLHLDRAVPSSAQPAASDPTVSIRAVSRSLAVKAGGCAMGVPVRARLRTQPSASAVTHGQRAGSAQVLVALHAHQPSRADNAGSIPVTLSTPGQRRMRVTQRGRRTERQIGPRARSMPDHARAGPPADPSPPSCRPGPRRHRPRAGAPIPSAMGRSPARDACR